MLYRLIIISGFLLFSLLLLSRYFLLPYPPKLAGQSFDKDFNEAMRSENLYMANASTITNSRKNTHFSHFSNIFKFSTDLRPAADRLEQYEHILRGRRIALLVNHTATVGSGLSAVHLVDTLLSRGHNIVKIFAPEHGFRGDADNGEKLSNSRDGRTGVPIISLYGEQRRPEAKHFEDIDIIIFDVQDVGVRFYTYTTSMTYMMEAAAEFGKPFLVLDRPNPNGHYVDGPVLDRKYASFVGLHPVPIVHGLTVAEYAWMINEEGWLKGGRRCSLSYVPCENYRHDKFYRLPLPPSPNLTSMRSIYLYPAICLFEGTTVSLGRGTDAPFERYGHPKYVGGKYSFTPRPTHGSKYPPHEGEICFGYDLTFLSEDILQRDSLLNLTYLIDYHKNFPKSELFFNGKGETQFFDKLAGTNLLRQQLAAGKTEVEIRQSWQPALEDYKKLRARYLLYP
jgi:uncharacterized protein YbbC (DUF1343 family)